MKNKKRILCLSVTLIIALLCSTAAFALTPNGVSVSSATAYSTASGSTSIGSIGVNENLTIGSTSGSRTYVTYRTSGADKSGWVSTSAVQSTGYRWPVDCENTTQIFNSSAGHLGMDMTSSISDDNITMPYAGTIQAKGYDGATTGNGNWVVVKYNNSLYSLFAHLASASTLTTGTSYSKGTVIGTMGNTGNSTGKHLHFSFFNTYIANSRNGYTTSAGTVVSQSTNKIVMDYSGTQVSFYNPQYVIRNNGTTP